MGQRHQIVTKCTCKFTLYWNVISYKLVAIFVNCHSWLKKVFIYMVIKKRRRYSITKQWGEKCMMLDESLGSSLFLLLYELVNVEIILKFVITSKKIFFCTKSAILEVLKFPSSTECSWSYILAGWSKYKCWTGFKFDRGWSCGVWC